MTDNEKFFVKFIKHRPPEFRWIGTVNHLAVWRYCKLEECDGCNVTSSCSKEDFYMPGLTKGEYDRMKNQFPEYFI